MSRKSKPPESIRVSRQLAASGSAEPRQINHLREPDAPGTGPCAPELSKSGQSVPSFQYLLRLKTAQSRLRPGPTQMRIPMNSDSCSDPNPPVIPIEKRHRFRFDPATCNSGLVPAVAAPLKPVQEPALAW